MHAVCHAQIAYTVICPTVGALTGVTTVNVSATTTLSTTSTNGSWSSSNSAIGSVGTTGVVTGISAGMTNISYITCPGYYATATVTVNNPGSVWDQPNSNSSWTYPALITKNSQGATGCGTATTALSGKLIWGYANNSGNTHLESVGISTALTITTNTNYLGASSGQYGLISGGNGVFSAGIGVTYVGTPNYGAGDTVYVVFDATTLLMWFGKYNATTHLYVWSGTSGNPSTELGGLSVAAGTYFAAGGDQNSNINTLIFGTNISALALSSSGATAKN